MANEDMMPTTIRTRIRPSVGIRVMVLEEGKFYIENDVVYVCIRDSGVPLYTALANVIGNYVEIYVG